MNQDEREPLDLLDDEQQRLYVELEDAAERVEGSLARLEQLPRVGGEYQQVEAEYQQVLARETALRRRIADRFTRGEHIREGWQVMRVWWPSRLYDAVRERATDPIVLRVLEQARVRERDDRHLYEVPVTREAIPAVLDLLDQLSGATTEGAAREPTDEPE